MVLRICLRPAIETLLDTSCQMWSDSSCLHIEPGQALFYVSRQFAQCFCAFEKGEPISGL